MGHFFWNEWNRAGLRIWKALGNYGKPRQKLQPPEGWSSMLIIFLVVQKSSKATPSSSLQMSQRKGKTGKTNINKHTKSSTSPNLDHIWCMWACSLFLPWPFAKLFDPFPWVGQGTIAGYVGKPDCRADITIFDILMEFFNLLHVLCSNSGETKVNCVSTCVTLCYKHSRLSRLMGNQMPFTVNQLSQSEKKLLVFTRAAVGEWHPIKLQSERGVSQ